MRAAAGRNGGRTPRNGTLFDAFEDRSGFSVSDVGFNVLGTGISYLRNTVPGLKEKVDFRLLLIPNRDGYPISNKKEHFRQERFLFALKLAGFSELRETPLRFVELHAGYYARGFTDRERSRGDERERKLFVGFGINLGELLFPSPRSPVPALHAPGSNIYRCPTPPCISTKRRAGNTGDASTLVVPADLP